MRVITSGEEWLLVDAGEASALGARARMIRRRRGLSLDVVAGRYLSMLERGRRGFNRRGLVEDLAEALGCSVVDLTGQLYLAPDQGDLGGSDCAAGN
jgi:transcriptional regulator with XRE-family HTH domain